ncbi:MAG: ATP-binding protein, partial [Acidimicrobiales bacterium]|nr:ATP-binding protein [Acidimicrobiales bacterium]
PTLVVIEHVEGAGPTRGTDAPLALAQFLTALDLADDALGPVVTVFTTGEVAAVDASVRAGGRLHSVVELPLPDLRARRAILDALVDAATTALGPDAVDDIDVAALARATEGATGADLHHIVRLALVGADGPITTASLLARARAGGWSGGDPGLYL